MKAISLFLVVLVVLGCNSESSKTLPYNVEDFVQIKRDFGKQKVSFLGRTKDRKDIVFELKNEAPILSLTNGIVSVVCDSCKRGKGKRVSVIMDDKTLLSYFHLSESSVLIGDTIIKGQQVGTSGSSGLTTVNGLGLSVKIEGKYVNPKAFY